MGLLLLAACLQAAEGLGREAYCKSFSWAQSTSGGATLTCPPCKAALDVCKVWLMRVAVASQLRIVCDFPCLEGFPCLEAL